MALLTAAHVGMIAPPAAAQSPGDPWWGPSSRERPTDGWAIRIPLVVENKFDYPITWDAVVSADIDFGKLLVEAGWTSQQAGTEHRLRGFTLDVDSIRVVEYGPGFSPGPIRGPGTEPTPHVFYESPFYADKYREFDPARNPAGTVTFLLKEGLGMGQKRFFYVYANPLEYGEKEPATFKLEDRAALDALLWGSSGTVFYSWEPNQDTKSNRIIVYPLTSQRTTVTLYERDFGGFVPSRSTGISPNPQILTQGMAAMTPATFYVPAGKAWKLEASHPITVFGHGALQTGATTEPYGYFPSISGSFAGKQFHVYGYDTGSGGNNPRTTLVAVKSGTGSVEVRVGGQPAVTLSPAEPVKPFFVPYRQWSTITSSAPILISTPFPNGLGEPAPRIQVPALSGGPSGVDFYFQIPRDGGYARVCPDDYTGVRIVDYARPDIQVFPEGVRDATPPLLLEPTVGCRVLEATGTTPQTRLEAYAIGQEARYPVPGAPVPFRLITGAEDRSDAASERTMVGHYGGLEGTDYYVEGRTGVFAYFNDTRITIYEELKAGGSVNRSFTMSRDDFQRIESPESATKTGRYQIVATKPISVASTEEFNHEYGRFVPGLPANPLVTLGRAEFRGPLVELRSPDTDGRQIFRSTGPETPITFRLEAINLGRWVGGDGLMDTISIVCTGPDDWDVEGCDREMSVASGNAERFEVTVTPTARDFNSTSFIEVEARSSTPGIVSKFRLAVYVEIRYGVGMWFDVENGRKTIDPVLGVDPGQTHDYTIVLKNTGSTADTFRLTVDTPKEGWTQELLMGGDPVTEVRLGGGESRTLTFRVHAPNQETAPQNFVSITAESVSSDLAQAKDIVNTATRIRPKININLLLDPPTRVAEPNETAQFNLTVTNRGNDVFTITIREDSILPEGWTTEMGIPGGEVSLNPNANYTFPYLVTPPLGAKAGELVTIKLAAETDTGGGGAVIPGDEVSAVVVVKRIHNITSPPLVDARAEPGEKIEYVLPLVNRGNGDDVVELLPGAKLDWNVRALEPALLLDYNGTGDFPLEIDVPRATPPGLHNLTLALRLSREAVQEIVVPVDVAAIAKVEIDGVTEVSLSPAREREVQLDVENVGNLPANFTLVADAPEGWSVEFTPANVELAPNDARQVVARINASRDATDGDYGLTLAAQLADGGRAGDLPLAIALARPALRIVSVDTSGDLSPGEVILVSATIANGGGIAAENVRVALVVDDRVVDQVTIARIPIGQSQVASLNWIATSRGADVRVVIDPEEQMVLATRDETRADVQFGSTLPLPGPAAGAALVVVALAALALGRRRRE